MPHSEIFPRQLLLKEDIAKVIRMKEFVHALSSRPHRHDHYTIMWITDGKGIQVIDGKNYPMISGRVFFMQPGQVHQMLNFERDGWLILFNDIIYNSCIQEQASHRNIGLLDAAFSEPYIDLNAHVENIFQSIVQLLITELSYQDSHKSIVLHYISILLLTLNNSFEKKITPDQKVSTVGNLIPQLQQLINQYFVTEQGYEFYAAKLNITPRKLNTMVKTALGTSLHDMLESRILTESKICLNATSLSIKEIAYKLGFSDPSYFNRFFKKHTSLTPNQYRSR